MATQQEVLTILAELVAQQSGARWAGSAGDRPGGGDNEKIRNVADRKFEAEVKKAEAAAKGMKYTTEVLPKKLKEAFIKSNSDFVKGMADSVKKFEDVLRLEDQAKAMQEVAKKLESMETTHFDSEEELDKHLKEIGEIAQKVGLSLEDMGVETSKTWDLQANNYIHFINKQKSTSEELIESSKELTEETKKAKKETQQHTYSVEKSKQKLGKFTEVVKNITKTFIKLAEQEQRYAQATATADAGWIKGMKDMQISQLTYMKLLKETRVEGLAAASAGVDFKKSLQASKQSLEGLTTNYEEAARVSGMFHKNMARIGVSQNNLGDAVLQQTKIYKENYRALGYTAEEFANLTSELVNDQGMRDTLLILQEKERKGYVLGIQRRMAEYQTMGYTIERAKELQKTFHALAGMDPKERMKKAAKKRAMFGAMGMAAEGKELFELEVRYRTMSAEEKLKADKRMAEIQAKGAKKFGVMSGSGVSIGQSMAMQMMAQKTGFDKVVQVFETASGEGLKIDQDLLNKTNEISGFVSDILGAMSFWGALTNSSIGSIGIGVAAAIGLWFKGKFLMNMIGSIVSKIMGGGGLASGAGSAVGSVVKGAGGMVAGMGSSLMKLAGPAALVAAAGYAGWEVGSAIYDNMSKETQKGIGDTIGPVVDNVLSFFGSDAAEERLNLAKKREQRVKEKAKEFKVPGRVKEKQTVFLDPQQQKDEVQAKQFKTGTRAKEKAKQEANIKEKAKQEASIKEKAKQEEQHKLLINTLQNLQKYLKTVNEQNSEQAKAVSKTAEAVVEGIRFNAMEPRRV